MHHMHDEGVIRSNTSFSNIIKLQYLQILFWHGVHTKQNVQWHLSHSLLTLTATEASLALLAACLAAGLPV
jgi:hypothetical protein